MLDWISDHVESIVTGIVAFFAGVWGTGKLFLGLRKDVDSIQKEQVSQRTEIEQIKQDASKAKEQRDQIEKNTRQILDHMLGKKSD